MVCLLLIFGSSRLILQMIGNFTETQENIFSLKNVSQKRKKSKFRIFFHRNVGTPKQLVNASLDLAVGAPVR